MNINIGPHELIAALIALFGLVLAGFWSFTRLMVGQIVTQFESRLKEQFNGINERFKYLEQLVSERHSHLSGDQQERRREIESLSQSMLDCRQQCAGRYVTTQEFYEILGPIQSKLEKLTDHVIAHR